ncbi:MAG TPA: hypothetical protein H9836_08760 [Candidatus Nocardiopsis merdipullorum]|nr:hypothetical protein [Candidatus Nocardiopsis merdipullorum]
MPGEKHEIPLKIFRNDPETVTALLREAIGYQLPHHTEAILTSAEFTDCRPRVYDGDNAVVLRDGTERVLGVVVEQQMSWDPDKYWTWPVYLTTARCQLECPSVLLVLCPSDQLAKRYSGPILLSDTGDTITPLVVGPSNTPTVVDTERARALPELAVLSARAHGDHEPQTLTALTEALNSVSPDRRAFYYDYVLGGLNEAAQKNLEDLMAVGTYEWQSDFARKYVGIGREEGREEEAVHTILNFLEERGIAVTDTVRQRIQTCQDINTLRTWVVRSATVQHAEDLFT